MNNLYIPCVIRETAEGTTRIPIQDLLFQHRTIELIGDITSDSVYALMLQLRYLQMEDANKEITVYINSPGGEVSSGLALYDVIKSLSTIRCISRLKREHERPLPCFIIEGYIMTIENLINEHFSSSYLDGVYTRGRDYDRIETS